jgi:hypothetical protein
MSYDDNRDFVTFYGIYTTNWYETYGTFNNTHYMLVRDYISDGCSFVTSSTASNTVLKFIYPNFIKKTFWVEGTAIGHITFAATGRASSVTNYRVSICKINSDNTDEELFTTGTIYTADGVAGTGSSSPNTYKLALNDEIVFPYWINCTPERRLGENDRIYVKVQSTTTNTNLKLCHDNSSTWEDLKIEIPFRL